MCLLQRELEQKMSRHAEVMESRRQVSHDSIQQLQRKLNNLEQVTFTWPSVLYTSFPLFRPTKMISSSVMPRWVLFFSMLSNHWANCFHIMFHGALFGVAVYLIVFLVIVFNAKLLPPFQSSSLQVLYCLKVIFHYPAVVVKNNVR